MKNIEELLKFRKIPEHHKLHTGSIPCGCIKDLDDFNNPQAVCLNCGATYDYIEVISYNIFRCYDCSFYKYQILEKKLNK